jgi:hypothetical protein
MARLPSIQGIESHITKVECRMLGRAMTAMWPDPKSEIQSIAIRKITARILLETDPEKLQELVEHLRVIVEAHLRPRPAN